MHGAQLLDVFVFSSHIENVEAFLPDLRRFGTRNPTHRKGRDEWGTRLTSLRSPGKQRPLCLATRGSHRMKYT